MALLPGSTTRAAMLALLEGVAGLTVYPDGAPDLAQPPYVTAWLSTDREDPDRLEGSTNRVWWRITTHSVARTPDAALKVQGLVRSALLNRRPVVGSTRVRHSNGLPPEVDESTGEVIADIVDQWTFQSWPTRL